MCRPSNQFLFHGNESVYCVRPHTQAIAEEDDLEVHDGASLLTAQQRRDSRRAFKKAAVDRKKEANERKKQERKAKKEKKEEAKSLKKLAKQGKTASGSFSKPRVGSRRIQDGDDQVQLVVSAEEMAGRTEQEQGEFDDFLPAAAAPPPPPPPQPTDLGQDVPDVGGSVPTRADSTGSTLVGFLCFLYSRFGFMCCQIIVTFFAHCSKSRWQSPCVQD